jgi:hypothetical protein
LEHLNRFVSSRGILRSCDLYSLSPRSSDRTLDVAFGHGIGSARSVYVCSDAVEVFAQELAPKIAHDVVLVSGDSDFAITSSFIEQPEIAAMLDSSQIKHWWAQNCAADHPKLLPIPIGNDYHTIWEHPGVFSHARSSPLAQETQLLRVLASAPSLERRFLTAYCNWLPTIDRGDRRECYDTIDQLALLVEPQRPSREAAWERQARCMFVASPEGVGIDCHRTWEALMLGCIPIVRRNALAPLFAHLPVWVVDHWSEVTVHALEEVALQSFSRTYDFSSLFLRFWQDRIHGCLRPFQLEAMTRVEFQDLLVGGRPPG